jgi:hypothetical protein
MTALFLILALETCTHMGEALRDYHEQAGKGDRYAQEVIALHAMACEASLGDEVGDLRNWDCIIDLGPGEAAACEYEIED